LFLRLIMWDCLIWHAGVTRQRDLTSLICVREVPKRVPNPARFWLVRHQERGMWSAKNEITINLKCKNEITENSRTKMKFFQPAGELFYQPQL
jgi:hypothetical protein